MVEVLHETASSDEKRDETNMSEAIFKIAGTRNLNNSQEVPLHFFDSKTSIFPFQLRFYYSNQVLIRLI